MFPALKKNITLFYSDHHNNQFLRLMIIGLLIRIILMPFFGHIDVLSEARRVYYWSENNIFLDYISRNTTMFIEVIFFKLTSFLLPDRNAMFFQPDLYHTTASHLHSFEFVSHSTVFRTLFILKLPFLVCDMLTAWAVYSYFPQKEDGLRSCAMWLFNPVTLFAFYIFGRFESIPIFFSAVAFLAVKKHRILLAAVLLGLCLNGREMMIFYFLVFLATVITAPVQQVPLKEKILASAIIIFFAAGTLNLFTAFAGYFQEEGGREVGRILKEGRVVHLFAFSLHRIMAIPLIYSLILIWIWTSRADIEKKVLLGCALAMMSFFAFSSHTAHFTSWMVIFPVLFYGYDRTLLKPFIAFCIGWIGHWAFNTDLGVFTWWLAAPFSLHFTRIPTLPEMFQWINNGQTIFDLRMMIYLFRTFFIASLIYMAYLMIRVVGKSDETRPV
ncbi:MAG: hypothetical protein SCH71_07225 [Desulfobulbaceae bacterium]|nr:hypothetical protein [Desulfobulbaceae bacterium]